MGFFNDLKEDIAQAYNELTDENAEKEIEMEELRLREELKALDIENSSEASFTFEDSEEDDDGLDPFLRSIIEGADDVEEALNDEANETFAYLDEAILEHTQTDDLTDLEEQFRAQLEMLGKEDNITDPVSEGIVDIPDEVLEEFSELASQIDEIVASEELEDIEEASIELEEPIVTEEDNIVIEEIEEKIEEEEMVIDNTQLVNDEVIENMETKRSATDETSVITQGLTVKGNIESNGNVEILGKVEGDIECLGKLNVSGVIVGNSKASEVFCDAAKITGEISASGTVKVGQSSVIIGNVIATSAVIAGAVKGDIDVKGPVILDTSAIVMGNIKSKSVQINNGAVIDGKCSQCYADVNPVAFFENL